MAYRAAIVDDNRIDASFTEQALTAWAENRQLAVQAECFDSAEKFLFRYAGDKAWDILLLDIEMGAMDGVTLAKRVRRRYRILAHTVLRWPTSLRTWRPCASAMASE